MATFTAGQKLRADVLNEALDGGTSAQYNAAATQTITTGTQPIVAFGTTNRTSTLVTRAVSGAGHKFTLLRAGIWGITSCVRWAGNTGGERYVLLTSSIGGLCSAGNPVGVLNGPVTISPSTQEYFPAGSTVWIEAFQNSGGNRDLEFNNGAAWGRISLTWLHA
jgi:hypothetical protein